MNAPSIRNAALAAVLAAGLVTLASPARAGHAHGHARPEWRARHGWYAGTHACPPRRVVVVPQRVVYRPVACPTTVWVRPASGLSVTFSGVFGNVAIGGRVDRPLPYGYAYADPYCDITFDSLSGYAEHCWHQHPAVAEVVAMRGPCERHDWYAVGDDGEWDR